MHGDEAEEGMVKRLRIRTPSIASQTPAKTDYAPVGRKITLTYTRHSVQPGISFIDIGG